jgi:plasmid maintenance system killer protein
MATRSSGKEKHETVKYHIYDHQSDDKNNIYSIRTNT